MRRLDFTGFAIGHDVKNWLIDPQSHNLDCGDNSCKYAVHKGGQRTNGGCRCSSNDGKKVEFFLMQNYFTALKRIEELEANSPKPSINDLEAKAIENIDRE